ncbi:putative defective proboscis extension response [Operophtera brumata]|uniref:Putative defective proboscis extension response n=1 Tax=Operophtera brumata TaxID=104452 RepID=A0A0L7LSL8_OPEBR|nr:putative defective proboscis extension response [Operophtera brumata]
MAARKSLARQKADWETRTVSWIRKRDLHILTVGVHTYSSDARFAALHADGSDEWTLRVAPAQPRDSGAYECQFYESSYMLEIKHPVFRNKQKATNAN